MLIPTRMAKLLAKWRGPYRIRRKIGKVNYEIKVPEAKHGKKILLVNLIKNWNEPEESFVNIVNDEQDEILYPEKNNRE